MASRKEERVRARAYELWQQGGGEHGQAVDHWLQAEREIGPDPRARPPARSTAGMAPGEKPAAKTKTQPKETPSKETPSKASSANAKPPATVKTAAAAPAKAPRAKRPAPSA